MCMHAVVGVCMYVVVGIPVYVCVCRCLQVCGLKQTLAPVLRVGLTDSLCGEMYDYIIRLYCGFAIKLCLHMKNTQHTIFYN
jgi:choline-glycine betaine transporter